MALRVGSFVIADVTNDTFELRDSSTLMVVPGGAIVGRGSGTGMSLGRIDIEGRFSQILNDGYIGHVRIEGNSYRPMITNNGTISGDIISLGTLIAAEQAGFPGLRANILNTGRITSSLEQSSTAAIGLWGDGNKIVNTGRIEAVGLSAIRIDADVRNIAGLTGNLIHNSGTLIGTGRDGAVRTGSQKDTLVNSGLIVGDVTLGSGADVFDGRGGRVDGIVRGGAGNDLYIIDDAGALIVEASGQGRDTLEAWVDVLLPEHIETLELKGQALRGTGNRQDNMVLGNAGDNVISGLGGKDTLFGDQGDDTLSGGSGADLLFGGEGEDVLRGGAGNDTLLAQDDDDVLKGGAGNDSLDGGAGDDRIWGGEGTDSIFGGADDDLIFGGAGNDQIDGGSGEDQIDGGTGNDTLFGNAGDDTLFGGSGRDRLDGGGDDDALYGGSGFDTVSGGAGDDLLDGGNGNDVLNGGAGDDTIIGGDGDDIITGGFGADLLDGGAGADTFVYLAAEESGGQGIDTIAGFDPGLDRVDLRGIDANSVLDGKQAFTFVGTAPFTGQAGQLRFQFALNVRELHADTDGDGFADFVLRFGGTVNFNLDSFLI